MSSPYDKLGDMLNEALASGNIPKAEKTESKKSSQTNEKSEPQKETQENSKNSSKKSTKNSKSVQNYIHLYKLFNLNSDCTKEELKSAYHSLLKKYHPDNIPDFPEMQKTAARKTQELVEAYNLLTDLIG